MTFYELMKAMINKLNSVEPLPSVSAADNGKVLKVVNGSWMLVDAPKECTCNANVYGVTWDLSSSNKLTRTDAATNFSDPTPSVAGSAGSSPFDTLMPWVGMRVVEDENAGTLVEIPKYYYRVVHDGTKLSVQIADGPADGFFVSPAHADRGDGKGERDVVYIGRYHCGGTNGLSISGAAPVVNMTRAQFREAFRQANENNGTAGYSVQDYAMFWTIRMLMLVEYATWDFQGTIGYGCGNGSSTENSGSTDSMPYHTGTVSATVDTYGVGVQYRYIEDMWANVVEFIDGWRIAESSDFANTGLYDVYVTLNPDEFSDTEGGTLIGTISANTSGWISNWSVPEVDGYSWAILPASATEDITNGNEYCADYCSFDGPALASGGFAYGRYPEYGPFLLGGSPADFSDPILGARLQKIP